MLNLAPHIRFNPEAAIVNYYHLDSSLSGHTDHSEKDLTQPLLSIRYCGTSPLRKGRPPYKEHSSRSYYHGINTFLTSKKLKEDNLRDNDRGCVPKVSFIQRFHCSHSP